MDSSINLREVYENNEDFKNYVDKYSIKHEISVDDALAHNIMIDVVELYKK